MSAIEQRARELLARMEKAKRNERGHWCDARAAVDSACEILPQLIAALTPPEGFVLVPVEVLVYAEAVVVAKSTEEDLRALQLLESALLVAGVELRRRDRSERLQAMLAACPEVQ